MFSQFPTGVLVILFAVCICLACLANFYARQLSRWSPWPLWLRAIVTHLGVLPLVAFLLFVAGLAFEQLWWDTIVRVRVGEVFILLGGVVLLALVMLDAPVLSRPEWMRRAGRLRVVPLTQWRRTWADTVYDALGGYLSRRRTLRAIR